MINSGRGGGLARKFMGRGGWLILAGVLAWAAHGAEIPRSAADLANRVLVRTAPNGAIQTIRMRAEGKFEFGEYRTNLFTYTREGLPADQAVLEFVSRSTFSGVLYTQTNRYALTFTDGDRGQYQLRVILSTVPQVQEFSGPFEISAGDNIAPRIWRQPESQQVPVGRSMGLSLGVAGFDLTFQWLRDGEAIPGATRASFDVPGVDASHFAEYTCRVSNALGTVTSQPARISPATPPVIVRAPVPAEVYEGGSATFTVEVNGTEPSYEWKLNGSRLAGGDGPTLTLNQVRANQAGFLTVTVVNVAGEVTSAPVALTVCATQVDSAFLGRPWVKILESNDVVPGSSSRFGPLIAPFNPTFTLWRKTVNATVRGDDNAVDPPLFRNALVRWRDGTLDALVFTNTLRPDGVFFIYPFYPTDEGAGDVNFTERDGLYSWRSGAVSLVAGTNTPAPGQPGAFFFGPGSLARRDEALLFATTLRHGDGSGSGTGLYLHDGSSFRRIADGTTDLPGLMTGYASRLTEDSLNLDGETIVFSTMAAISGPGGVYRATYDGTVTKLLDTADLIPGLTNAVVSFGDVDVEGDLVFAIAQINVRGNPQGRVLGFERNGSVKVIGSGEYLVAAGPRQVYFGNAGSIQRWTDGVTETVLNSAAVLGCRRLSGVFDVEAQGDDVAVGVLFQDRSVGIYASFGEPEATASTPKILVQPRDVVVPSTTPATFSVVAVASGPVAYQWRRDGAAIPGGTNAVLTVSSATEDSQGVYDVVVSAGGAAVNSRAVRFTLTAAPLIPIIFGQPASKSVPIGAEALLSVTAAGAPPLAYQWLLNTNPIPGATTSSFAVVPSSNTQFRVVVSNSSGVVTSQVASVTPVPIITRQPQSQTVAEGGTATFTVEASGFQSYRYFWFRSDQTTLAGKTNAVLTFSSVTEGDEGEYFAMVLPTSGGGSVRSQNFRLTVDPGTGSGGDPEPVTLGGVVVDGTQLKFAFRTRSAALYAVEKATQPVGATWSEVARLTGDGAELTVRVAIDGSAGFVRVRSLP